MKSIMHIRKLLGRVKWSVNRFFEVRRARVVANQYARTIERIRNRPSGQHLKVVFLVNETAKWKVQAVCDEMRRRGGYEIVVALTMADCDRRLDDTARKRKMHSNMLFFRGQGFDVVNAFDVNLHCALDLNLFNPDVVFYPHPWALSANQLPSKVAKRAITCYVPYFVPTFGNPGMHLGQPLHKEIFRHFVLNRQWADYYKSLYDKPVYSGEIMGLGHPMIDGLGGATEDPGPDGVVIYAPHWSIPHPKINSFLDLSTFLLNGNVILDYARAHPEIKWAFKPHPSLRTILIQFDIMPVNDIDAYYRSWEEIGEACYTGDYVDLFRRSRALITDCDSFLAEYACTKKPIVHLISPVPNKRQFSPMQALFDTYYKVHDNEELQDALHRIVICREDPNKGRRLDELSKSGLVGVNASKNIVDHIENLLGVRR